MNYFDNNDYELIYLIKEENEEALNIILKKYEPLVRKIANYYYQNNKDLKIEYEDLIQEGRIGLYSAVKGYNTSKDVLFFTFAILCIKRQIIDMITKTKRQKNHFLVNALSLNNTSTEKGVSYEDPLILVEENDLIMKIIHFKNNLDFIDANIFELRYNSFSYQQIAKLLELSKKAIDNRLLKIRRKLKKYLLDLN